MRAARQQTPRNAILKSLTHWTFRDISREADSRAEGRVTGAQLNSCGETRFSGVERSDAILAIFHRREPTCAPSGV